MTSHSNSIEEGCIYNQNSIVKNKFDKIPRKFEIVRRTNLKF